MPITNWWCPICNSKVALDHYVTTACGLKIHPDYAQAILNDRAEPHHTEGMVTVTAGLSCPRSRALEVSDENLTVNPLDYNALLIGQAWDKFITGNKMVLQGELTLPNGQVLQIAGEIDNVRRWSDELLVEDWKHSNNNQQRFIKKEIAEGVAVKMEYRIQTSIYAELYRQQHGEQPTKGLVWNHYSGAQSGYNDPLIPLMYDFIPLETALNYYPYGGDYTVAELYAQAAQLHNTTPIKWSNLPLAGETMMFGKQSMCSYCQVRDACFTQAKNAPF